MHLAESILTNSKRISTIESVRATILRLCCVVKTFNKMSDETTKIENEASATETMSKRAMKRQKYQLSKEEKKKRCKERRAVVQENRDVGFPEVSLEVTDYYFENGLRKVKVRVVLPQSDMSSTNQRSIFYY